MQFNPKHSWGFLSADEIATKTIRALRNHIRHVKEISPYYKEAFWDINPEDFKNIDDFLRLPFTGRTALYEYSPRFQATTSDDIVETVATAGVSGRPLFCPMTATDLDRLAFSEALSFDSIGITDKDRILLFNAFDRLALGGMGNYRGATLLGANTARAGMVPHDLFKLYLDIFKPTVLVGAPPFLRKCAADLKKSGFATENCSVKKIVCTSEGLKSQDMQMNATAKKLEALWGAKAYSIYSATEIASTYGECSEQTGNHAHPELVYSEIIGENGQLAPDGMPGELVVTPLGVEGMPLVRYRTGDITFKVPGTCACGRNSTRIGPILGRTAQIIHLRSTTVFPLTLTSALDELDELNDYVIILENDSPGVDRVSIHVAAPPSLVEKISNQVRNVAHVQAPILISNISTIQSMRGPSRQSVRIVDWRQQAQLR